MVGEVFAGLGAIKTAFDIAKGLKDIDDAARRNAAVIELQEKILAAQQEQMALVERITEPYQATCGSPLRKAEMLPCGAPAAALARTWRPGVAGPIRRPGKRIGAAPAAFRPYRRPALIERRIAAVLGAVPRVDRAPVSA